MKNLTSIDRNKLKTIHLNCIVAIAILLIIIMTSLPALAQWGNGSAGPKTFGTGTHTIDDTRTKADISTTKSVIVTNTAGFLVGDMVLIIDMISCTNNQQNWEFQTITEINGNTISFVKDIIPGFSEGQLIKVKQYTNVTIEPGAVVTCSPWDGEKGGVAVLMANGTLTFEGTGANVGKIDVSGKGYRPGNAGDGGAGGDGGSGGDPGMRGEEFGNAGQGIAGAGWGAKKGSVGGEGTYNWLPTGCGSGNPSSNLSIGNIKWILPGGGGTGGKGGDGGAGAGGAGGDSQICEDGTPQVPAIKGGDGEYGGNGGDGGTGGAGAGIIIISARNVSPAPLEGTPLIARGADGSNAPFTATGGGPGGIANFGMGAGGGDGANGGNGGTGGAGGAGGFIWVTASNWSSLNVSQHRDVAGGSGGVGGAGGTAGEKGQNADAEELVCGISIPVIPVINEYFCACEEVWEMLLETNMTPMQPIYSNTDPFPQIGQTATFTKPNITCIVTSYGELTTGTKGRLSIVCTDENDPNNIKKYYCDMDQIDPLAGTDDPWGLITSLTSSLQIPDNYQQCDLYSTQGPNFEPPQYHAPCCDPVPGQPRIEPVAGLPGENGDTGSTGNDGGDGGEGGPDCSITVPAGFQKLCGSGPLSRINITASGGNGPYTWTHEDGNGNVTTLDGNGETIETREPPDGPGKYCVTDADGCTACIDIVDPDPVPVIIPEGPTNFFEGGSVTLDAGGGFASYSWTKDGAPYLDGEGQQNITVNESGEYCVTVSDEYTCEGSDCIEITVHPVCPENVILECWNDLPYLLSGNSPAGGIYSGDGVYLDGSEYYFSTVCDDMPIGSSIDFVLTYSFTDPIYGMMSCSFTITVVNGGIVYPCLDNVTICRTVNVDLIFGNVTFNPYLLPPDVYEINYTLLGYECTSYVTVEGILNPSCPHFELEVCITDEPFWMGDIYIDPAALGAGVHYFNCTLTNSCGPFTSWNPDIKHKVTVYEPGTYVCPNLTLCDNSDPRYHCGVWIDPSELCNPLWGQCSQVIEFENYIGPCGEIIDGSFTVTVFLCVEAFPYPYVLPDVEWTIISLPFQPFPPDIEIVFESATYLGQLEVVLGKQGIYWPSGSINTIGNWDVYQAYKIKMNSPGAIWSIGTVPEDKTITVTTGANYIPVLSPDYYPAGDIFAQLGTGLIFAYDLNTELLYWPQGGIYELEVLEPGKGYLVGMSQPGQATYDTLLRGGVKNHTPAKPKVYDDAPWSLVKSGSTHFVAINKSALGELEAGDFIGVFNPDGICSGMAQYENKDQNLLLVAYGNDFTVKSATGLAEGENMSFRIFRPSANSETTASVTYDASMPNTGQYAEYGRSMIINLKTGYTSVADSRLNSIKLYPNPSRDVFKIEGYTGKANVTVFNAFGKEVFNSAMHLPSEINLSDQAKGIYVITIKTDDQIFFDKLILY